MYLSPCFYNNYFATDWPNAALQFIAKIEKFVGSYKHRTWWCTIHSHPIISLMTVDFRSKYVAVVMNNDVSDWPLQGSLLSINRSAFVPDRQSLYYDAAAYSMTRSPSSNSPHLWNPKVHYSIHMRRQLPLFRAKSIQPMHPSHFLNIRFNIILPSTPRISKWSRSLRSPHRSPVYTSALRHTCHMHRQSHSSWFDHLSNIWWAVQIIKLLNM